MDISPEFLKKVLETLEHSRVFVGSKQAMGKKGIEVYDRYTTELRDTLNKHIQNELGAATDALLPKVKLTHVQTKQSVEKRIIKTFFSALWAKLDIRRLLS